MYSSSTTESSNYGEEIEEHSTIYGPGMAECIRTQKSLITLSSFVPTCKLELNVHSCDL